LIIKKVIQKKIADYLKSEFNYAFRVICRGDHSVRQLLPDNLLNIPNKYIEASHLLDEMDIQWLVSRLFPSLFFGKYSEYLRIVTNYLDQKAEKLTDEDAHRYLLSMILCPADKYRNWFKEANPKFITEDQVESFIKKAKGEN